MLTCICLLLLCLGAAPAFAQQAVGGGPGEVGREVTGLSDIGQIGNAAARSILSLNGEWDAIIDPYDTGLVDYKSRPLKSGFWADRKPSGPMDLVEYDFDTSDKLKVPGDWNTQAERLFFYEGAVWYRRVFEAAPDAQMRQFIRLEGANQRSTVWLNGTLLGGNSVGFTPKAYEATGTIRTGRNSLVVRVDNRRDATSVPGLRTDWWNYGGITRRADVLQTPNTYIKDVHVELSQDRSTVQGWIALDGPQAASRTLRIAIGGVETEVATNERGMGSLRVARRDLGLWSPESPKLHDLEVKLVGTGAAVVDTFHDRVGLRTIATDGGRILLNGKRIGLLGVCAHEERISGDGRSWSEADARELARKLKALGCNFVRLAHYPHAEIVSRVMDEEGIMVWAEIPVYWKLDYGNPATLDEAYAHLDGLIGRDHNRASVIVWSIGNETEVNDASTTFRNKLAERVRTLDRARLLAAALEASLTIKDGHVVKMVLSDPFAAAVDLLAINSYIGWYVGHIEDMATLPVTLGANKPFIISEFGADAKRGRAAATAGVDEIWTEEYQAKLYRSTLDWFEGLPNFAGCTPWILSDFRSPRRLLPGVQDYWNRKGLLDERGEPKAAHGVLKQRYERWAERWPVGE